MNIKTSSNVFPSYRAIQETTQKSYIRHYQNKIHNLKTHLNYLQEHHDFEKDHQQIQLSIMTLSAQNSQEQHHLKGKLKVIEPEDKNRKSKHDYGQSLNYYLEDDGQQDNNYQTLLKFKKKALERDIEEQSIKTKEALAFQNNKKRKQQEQLFFRKLYVNEPDKQLFAPKRSWSANKYRKKPVKAVFDIKEAKQNAGKFLNKLNKKSYQSNKNIEPKIRTMKKIAVQTGIESEIASFQKNRKYLTENYLDILKKLDSTNIVKWRVLNAENQQNQKG